MPAGRPREGLDDAAPCDLRFPFRLVTPVHGPEQSGNGGESVKSPGLGTISMTMSLRSPAYSPTHTIDTFTQRLLHRIPRWR
jgi:hypothetical protein